MTPRSSQKRRKNNDYRLMRDDDVTFYGNGPLDKLKKGLSPFNLTTTTACVIFFLFLYFIFSLLS